ncbi:MAG: thioredoxin [Chloroflexi bacterium]|nr:thioredoxin [Chloroflexota bacterium]
MAKPIELDDKSFDATVTKGTLPVLVDFWAAWCGPCRMVSPIVEELAQEYDGKMDFGKLDVDKYPAIANKYSVRSIPTLIVFQKGQPAKQFIGYRPKAEFKKDLDSLLASPGEAKK